MGWNRPSNDQKTKTALRRGRTPRPTLVRGLIAGSVAILVGAATVWFIHSPSGETRRDAASTVKQARIKEVKHAKVKVYREETKVEKTKELEPVLPSDPGSVSNRAAREAFLKRARANPETWFLMTNKNQKTEQVFETCVDQALNNIFNTELGDDPPIPPGEIPIWEKRRLAEILINKIEVTEEDSDRMAERKEQVQFAKNELKKFIKEGGDPEDFFGYYYKELRKAHDRREDSAAIVRETVKTDDPEIARKLLDQVNEMLTKDGIKPIVLDNEDMLAMGYTFDTEEKKWK